MPGPRKIIVNDPSEKHSGVIFNVTYISSERAAMINRYTESECANKCECFSSMFGRVHSKEDHVCCYCRKKGYNHAEEDCEDKCPCGLEHNKKEHICRFCEKEGYAHAEKDCPKKCPCGHGDHTVKSHKTAICNY